MKQFGKRLTALVLAGAMAFALAACGGGKGRLPEGKGKRKIL